MRLTVNNGKISINDLTPEEYSLLFTSLTVAAPYAGSHDLDVQILQAQLLGELARLNAEKRSGRKG